MVEGARWHVHAQNVRAARHAFLEAGRQTIRPLAQRGGSSGSNEGAQTCDLGKAMDTETDGNEPKDEPSPHTVGGSQALGQDTHTEEGEEGRRSKGLSAPVKVSREEREEHERTLTPYRAWCPACVKARGKATPHMKSKEAEEEAVPKISMDYFFMSKKDEEAK